VRRTLGDYAARRVDDTFRRRIQMAKTHALGEAQGFEQPPEARAAASSLALPGASSMFVEVSRALAFCGRTSLSLRSTTAGRRVRKPRLSPEQSSRRVGRAGERESNHLRLPHFSADRSGHLPLGSSRRTPSHLRESAANALVCTPTSQKRRPSQMTPSGWKSGVVDGRELR
jgi:hypothetical protein